MMNDIPVYENALVRLRAPRLDDAAALMQLTHHAAVMRYYGMAPYQTLAEAEGEIRWFLGLFEKNEGGRWAIADVKTDQFIGDVGVFNFSAQHQRVEIGFKLHADYWQKGIMHFCVNKVLAFCFTHKHYNRVEALVDDRNIACQKTLLKCGFALDGVLREYEYENGSFINLHMYSCLRRDFAAGE